MAAAFKGNIIFPNKKIEDKERFYHGHLLENETYVGGKVEALHSGVYRSDIPTRFNLVAAAYQTLIDRIDATIDFAVRIENGMDPDEITNRDELRA